MYLGILCLWMYALLYGMCISLHLSSYTIYDDFGICVPYYLGFLSEHPPSHDTAMMCLPTIIDYLYSLLFLSITLLVLFMCECLC